VALLLVVTAVTISRRTTITREAETAA